MPHGACLPFTAAAEPTAGLVGHWPLATDARDRSGAGRDMAARDIQFSNHFTPGVDGKAEVVRQAAFFNGKTSSLELPSDRVPRWGTGDFAVSMWVLRDDRQHDVPGDLASQYDVAARRGWHVTLKSSPGVTFSQANFRRLQFGIDDRRTEAWEDVGRPGDGLLAFSLIDFHDMLFAGVCRPGKNESGRLYRYLGGTKWEDCGAPDASNTVTALAQYKDELYVGTGKYRVAGSALPESENEQLGGRIFRYDPAKREFTACGSLPGRDAVSGLVVFRDQLYAGSLYKPAGFFAYRGGTDWQEHQTPADLRVEAMTVHNGFIYATTYDGGHVFRFDGITWTPCEPLAPAGTNTQTYAFTTYQGKLLVGTWPSGRVYQLAPNGSWIDLGRLGEELEVMGMYVHNGRLLAGTLPSADIYEFDHAGKWQKLAQLDSTPNVKYRRAWTMCEYRGRLFCSTLPSGKVFAMRAGQTVASSVEFPTEWTHVAAVRRGRSLELYVNGTRTVDQMTADTTPFELTTDAPLQFGAGQTDHFDGALREIRLYDRSLSEEEVKSLASGRP